MLYYQESVKPNMQKVKNLHFLKYPFVARNYPAKVIFSDNEYNLPTYSYIFNKFYPYFQKELFRLKIDGWSQKFDCEDFAKLFKTLIQACHAQSKGNAEGIAVAEIHYKREDGVNHAINAIITDKGLIFLEPQTGESLVLTENEEKSIYYVNF